MITILARFAVFEMCDCVSNGSFHSVGTRECAKVRQSSSNVSVSDDGSGGRHFGGSGCSSSARSFVAVEARQSRGSDAVFLSRFLRATLLTVLLMRSISEYLRTSKGHPEATIPVNLTMRLRLSFNQGDKGYGRSSGEKRERKG